MDKFYRFTPSNNTFLVDPLIDRLSSHLKIDSTDEIKSDGIYFIGGSALSGNRAKILQEKNIPFFSIDKGYFKNSKKTSHWRVSFNEFQSTRFFNCPDDRIKNFSIFLKDWKTDGDYILILAPSENTLKIYYPTTNLLEWCLNVKNEILKYTDKKIFIRFKDNVKKGNDGLEKYLDNCYLIVSLQSLSCVKASQYGINSINLVSSCLDMLDKKNYIQNVSNLNYPKNRYDWYRCLSYCQFTEKEFEDGTALEIIKKYYPIKKDIF